jgi:putative spermidine/putrescine transport system permease protein
MGKNNKGVASIMAGKCTEQNAITLEMKPRFTITALKRGGRWIPLFSFLLFIMSFEIFPFFRMVLLSLEDPSGGISLFHYYDLASQKFQLIALKNSITLSLVSSLLGLVIGIMGANALTHLKVSLRNRILVLTNLTSNFAGVPLAFSYIVLLGTNGILTLGLQAAGIPLYQYFTLYSWAGLTLIYIYFQVPLAIMLLYPSFLGLRAEWKDAVKNLGGSDVEYWRYVGLPAILPSLSDTFSILFANAIGAYATAYALTSGNYALAPLRIGNLIAGNVEINPNLAAAISITMALCIIGFMSLKQVFTSVSQRRRKYDIHQ